VIEKLDGNLEGTKAVHDLLKQPFLDARRKAGLFIEKKGDTGMQEELKYIMEVVKTNRQLHRKAVTPSGPDRKMPFLRSRRTSAPAADKSFFTDKGIVERQQALREASSDLWTRITSKDYLYMGPHEVKRIAASYAYFHDLEEGKKCTRYDISRY
jgi:hypothetical protein